MERDDYEPNCGAHSVRSVEHELALLANVWSRDSTHGSAYQHIVEPDGRDSSRLPRYCKIFLSLFLFYYIKRIKTQQRADDLRMLRSRATNQRWVHLATVLVWSSAFSLNNAIQTTKYTKYRNRDKGNGYPVKSQFFTFK